MSRGRIRGLRHFDAPEASSLALIVGTVQDSGAMRLQLITSRRKFLQVILWLRVCAIVNQSITIVLIQKWLGITLPDAAMGAAIAGLAVIALLTALRLRAAVPVTELEVALQLLIDISELTILLCLSGGTANPFASLYLVPVALAAVGLGWQYTAAITGACLGCYFYLIDRFTTLGFMHMTLAHAFNLHVAGMNVTFAVSSVLLAAALSMTAAQARRQDQAMAILREEMMRKDHLNAMGVLAAGAAHELSTPLLSMALIASELRDTRRMDAEFRDNIELLEKQIAVCKQKLGVLLQSAASPGSPRRQVADIQAVVREVLDGWSIVRPAIRLEVTCQELPACPLIVVDEGFKQALFSLLDNAAEASQSTGSDLVHMVITGDRHGIRLYIDDEGPGLSAEMQQRAGKALFTTKEKGFGLGLVLSHANLNRLQGDLTLTTRPEGGTRTTISVPLHVGELAASD